MAQTSKLGLTVYDEADKSTVLWAAYWRAMSKNDSSSNMKKIDAEFAKIAQKFSFTIAADATWSALQSSDPYKYQTTVSITANLDGSTIMATFDSPINSRGVILASAVQNGSLVELTFYSKEAKTVAVTGVILYVY